MASSADPPPADPAAERQPLVELKNSKVVFFKQKPLALEKLSETMKEIVDFREMLSQAVTPLPELPSQHHPLIAKLVHESDKTLSALSKNIHKQLAPDDIGLPKSSVDNSLTSAIEKSINVVAERINYGAEPLQTDGRPKTAPASLCFWRWEVKDLSLLPQHIRDKAESRRLERTTAKADLTQLLNSLSSDQRAALFGLKQDGIVKAAPAAPPIASTSQGQASGKENEPIPVVEKRGPGRPPKEVAAQPEVSEKDVKAQEATKKSAAAFASFFKPKAKPPKLPEQPARTESTSTPNQVSDFSRTFHPFVVKKGVQVAPVNYFQKRRKDMIVIDGCEERNGRARDVTDIAQDLLGSVPLAPRCRSSATTDGLKTSSAYSVKQLQEILCDAEIRGDEQEVARLLRILRDRAKIPLKILSFANDNRPGYIGTWTRQSSIIGPRTPFAKDVVALDYTCDSGEEWEDEEEGEDVVSDGGSARDDGEMSDEDSLDGWLVGDEEDVGGEPIDLAELEDAEFDIKNLKRKKAPTEDSGAASKDKRRKVVVPLVPFIRGPYWETNIGECPTWDGFIPHQIQLFNDAQYPIDPFTYVSKVVSEKSSQKTSGNKQSSHLPTVPQVDCTMLPGPQPVANTTNASAKAVFPGALLPALRQAIQNCKTGSLSVLVDSIFQLFKQDHPHMKVKKYTIESKVKEIAQKAVDPAAPSSGKVWRLVVA